MSEPTDLARRLQDTAEAFDSAEAALSRAMALDPSTPEVWLSLAKLRWMHAPDLVSAEQAIHSALKRDSSAAEVHFEHARILAMREMADSAMMEMDREASTPMFRRDSIWMGETARSTDSDRSSGWPLSSSPGRTGTGTLLMS